MHEFDELVHHLEVYVVSLGEYFRCHQSPRVDHFAENFNIIVAGRSPLDTIVSIYPREEKRNIPPRV